jgi:uncharacterized protein YcbX
MSGDRIFLLVIYEDFEMTYRTTTIIAAYTSRYRANKARRTFSHPGELNIIEMDVNPADVAWPSGYFRSVVR